MITTSSHASFDAAWNLYERAFPLSEKRTKEEQEKTLQKENYSFMACFHEESFIGILGFWKIEDYLFIEHFAIDEALRGQNYGSKVLTIFLEKHTEVFLEIEPPLCEISKRRLKFYQNLGFVQNVYEHYQLPFRDGDTLLSLRILSWQTPLKKERYDMLYAKMQELLPL